MKIGLLGGSFDPCHDGHLLIARTALTALDLDEVWFIPVLNNPFQKNIIASPRQRVKMLKLAIGDEKRFKICDIELESEETSYTIKTLLKLQERYPDHRFYYLIGQDQTAQFHLWYEAAKIAELCQLVSMARPGVSGGRENIEKYHMMKVDYEPVEVSSTAIRQGDLRHVPKKVVRYFSMEGLYLDTIIDARLSPKRAIHSKSVAELAVEIAKGNHLDAKKAYTAGMLHDIGKEIDPSKAKELMAERHPKHLDMAPPVWHQWLSRDIARKEFHIKDKEVLNAIKHHTTGSTRMSKLDMCIYVADKLDPARGRREDEKIALAKKDIGKAFVLELESFYRYSKEKNRPVDEIFFKVYETYKGA